MTTLVLHYAGCSTCKKALAWLKAHDIAVELRPIVDQPPTEAELARWIPASALSVRRWLNTSGLSYRALGKAAVDAMSEAELVTRLSQDGKLVRRPVLIAGQRVLVGFDEKNYAAVFAP